jgi:hypothetical protein
MGYIPGLIALSAFIFLWTMFVSNQLKKAKANIITLQANLDELRKYELERQKELSSENMELVHKDLMKESNSLLKAISIQKYHYNRLVNRAPSKFLAYILGYKAL